MGPGQLPGKASNALGGKKDFKTTGLNNMNTYLFTVLCYSIENTMHYWLLCLVHLTLTFQFYMPISNYLLKTIRMVDTCMCICRKK